jgi:hypothetical protein
MKEKAPKYFSIKTKVEYEIVIEAEDKAEATEWAIQVLPEIIILDTTYSDRVMLKNREIKVGTIKKVTI